MNTRGKKIPMSKSSETTVYAGRLSNSSMMLIFASSLSLILTACGGGEKTITKTTTTTTTTTTTKTIAPGDTTDSASSSLTGAGSALPMVNSQSPGPYKIIDKDGISMREGRFSDGQAGGTLIRATFPDPKTFNYWAASDLGSRDIAALMFSGLLSIDPYNGEVIPDLAESFNVDKDGLTYTAKLRKGLVWSDGKPITSEDVVFTWNTLIKGGYGNSSLRDVTTINGASPKVTAVDALTVKFETPVPFAPFLRLIGIPFAPKHIIKPIIDAPDGRKNFDQFWSVNSDPKSFVVSGPYKIKQFVPSQRVTLEANPKYSMVNKKGEKLPYLSAITYLLVPDSTTSLLKFRARETDVQQVRPRDVLTLMPVREKEDFQLYNLGPSIGTYFITFNQNRRSNPKTKKPYVSAQKSAWFNDVNFRQAINHVLNREQMVANYFKGLGFPQFSSEPQSSPYFNPEIKGFKPDSAYSLSLLEKSGFKKKEDGKLYDKDGNRVEFTIIAPAGSTFSEAVGNMIVNDLLILGIKANLQLINFNILINKTENSLDWESCIFSLQAGDPLEPNDGANVYKSDGRLHVFDQRIPGPDGKTVVTDARPWEKRLDEIFNQGATTLDKSKRMELYREYQKIISEQAPFVYLINPMTIYAVRNTIQNYQPTFFSQPSGGLHNVEELWKK